LQGEGSTLGWCDALSVTVGLVDIAVVAAIGVCFVYIKVKSMSIEAEEDEVVPEDSSKKKRRLSSRELMIEMASQHLQTNIEVTEEGGEEVNDGEGGGGGGEEEEREGGGEVIVTLGVNPMHATRGGAAPNAAPTAPATATPNAARARWNTLKQATRASRTFRNGGKQRVKRLSKVMKARQNESGETSGGDGTLLGGEVKTVSGAEDDVSIHVDEETGHRYSYDAATGQTQWLSDDEGLVEGDAMEEEQGEGTQESASRSSFRKIVDGDNAVCFQNVDTGETVGNMPKNGDEVL
jgi:hypothetical protein